VKRILFDTNTYVAFKRGGERAAEVVRLELGFAVYTHDEHFQAIEGLVAEKSPAAFLP
jgi:predicted nucleic acid-binding protein